MATETSSDDVPLPKSWPANVKSAVIQVISLAYLAIIYSRSGAANSLNAWVRLQGKLEQCWNEVSSLEEELRIKDSRTARLDAHRRPHYRPTARLEILELKAARGWSAAQTARTFLVEPETVREWLGRVDEEGKTALVQTNEPANRFPAFVRHLTRRLKVLCPTMGKKRIAEMLARAGLHLRVTTVGRMLRENDIPAPAASGADEEPVKKKTRNPVASDRPDHVWLVDLTVVPTSAGSWAAWMPFAFPQLWPLCWWLSSVVDQYSRKVMGFALFPKEPSSVEIRRFLGRTAAQAGALPKYLISDKGGQFTSPGFEKWCKGEGIQPRYAAAGRRGATLRPGEFLPLAKAGVAPTGSGATSPRLHAASRLLVPRLAS